MTKRKKGFRQQLPTVAESRQHRNDARPHYRPFGGATNVLRISVFSTNIRTISCCRLKSGGTLNV